MRLTRNTTPDGRCKYAIVRLDKLRKLPPESLIAQSAAKALDELAAIGLLEYGEKGSEEEFFVIKLKDLNAPYALRVYAFAALVEPHVDRELSKDVFELEVRAQNHPNRKRPD